MNCVIYRIYTTPEGKKKFLQGKIFKPKRYDYSIYYRDIYPKRSTLWKTRYEKPESESFNIDHLVYDYLRKEQIKEIHYYVIPKKRLYRIEIDKIERHIKRGNVKHEMLNNHTQYFIPTDLFHHSNRDYSVPWITAEVSINDLLREKNEELADTKLISTDVRLKLAEAWKNSQKAQKESISSSQQLSII